MKQKLLTSNIRNYMSFQKQRYSVWVYDGSLVPKVYDNEMPNTYEVWFQFNKFSYIYWKIFEQECVFSRGNDYFYDFIKIKRFMLERMLYDTNLPNIKVKYDQNGKLQKKVLDKIYKVHPRILRSIMDKVQFFPNTLSKKENKEIEKQCAKLFGSGQSVSNPHEMIMTYCNLVSFWDKFGLNYFDIMKMPRDLYNSLKKIMTLESDFRNKQINDSASKNHKK